MKKTEAKDIKMGMKRVDTDNKNTPRGDEKGNLSKSMRDSVTPTPRS